MIKAMLIGIALGLLMLVVIHPYAIGASRIGLVIALSMMLALAVAPLVFISLLAPNIRKRLSESGAKPSYLLALLLGCFGTIAIVYIAVSMGGH